MKTQYWLLPGFAATIIALMLAGAILLRAQPPQPAITILPAAPSTINVGGNTPVTITAQISDSRVIATGVNLLQVDPTTGTQSVAGTLAANGQTFSITFFPSTMAPRLFTYQVSAAFRGILKRSLSPLITVAVAPQGLLLPSDPGPAGIQTLAGIDSDNDGVRDDVERWIAVTQPTSTPTRNGLLQETRALQDLILAGNGHDRSQAVRAASDQQLAELCLASITGGIVPAGHISDQLTVVVLNTAARSDAYASAQSLIGGANFPDIPIDKRASACK